MKLSLFDYHLPKEMIATEPASPRDAAKFLVYDRATDKTTHTVFNKIGDYLQKGDVLVLNDTKVIPARLIGRLIHSDGVRGRKFKILLLEKKAPTPSNSPLPPPLTPPRAGGESLGRGRRGTIWTCLIDGRGREEGLDMDFSKGLCGKILKRLGGGIWEIKFNKSGKALEALINKLGVMPLPPYIKQKNIEAKKQENKRWYQTVFAKYAGSVAAPTAGLHFTPRLLSQLKKRGIKIEYVTLHVGMGTFMPVKTEKIEEHKMHEELAIILPKTARALNAAKKSGRRIVACGTTSARTLESFAILSRHCEEAYSLTKQSRCNKDGIATLPAVARNDRYFIRSGKKRTKIFIYPPYNPKFVDALITNFHLPKSTLMMLLAAFLSPGDKKGIKVLQDLYAEAIQDDYRFYSYGDAMLIL